MKTNNNVTKKSFKGIEAAGLVIIGCFVVAICIYHFVFGNPAIATTGKTVTALT